MSTDGISGEQGRGGSGLATALFLSLVALSLFWPDPVIWINEQTLGLDLAVDRHSSFGREPFQWDLPLWLMFGFLFIHLLTKEGANPGGVSRKLLDDLSNTPARIVGIARRRWLREVALVLVLVGAVVATLAWLDSFIIGWLSSVPEAMSEPFSRPMNRLGGGAIPTLIALFLIAHGISQDRIRVARQGIAVGVVSLIASLPMALAKGLIGRARPEWWEGPFRFFGEGESFPSGHTLAAFSIAAVIWLSRAYPFVVRVAVLILAGAVGISRLVTFRHWPSDILASAVLAFLISSIVVPALDRGR